MPEKELKYIIPLNGGLMVTYPGTKSKITINKHKLIVPKVVSGK